MFRKTGWAAAALAAASAVACTPRQPEADAHEALRAALTGASRAQGCALELWSAADRDPGATAALLGLEPIALAPWGGAGRGKGAVREAVLSRAAVAQDAARAARSLALLGAYASADQDALRREKIAGSLAASDALCRAAERARGQVLAAPREARADRQLH
jgi:hypothetical protein